MSDKPIWERRPDETDSSYRGFCTYRDDLSGRTLLSAYRVHSSNEDAKHVPGWFAAWSVKYEWTLRVRAYDAVLEQQARAEREALWLERQKQLLEDEWDASRKLLKRALGALENDMMEYKMTADAAARFLQLASALGRQATGLDVVKHEHTGANGGPVEHVAMSLEEWKEVAAKRRKAAEEALDSTDAAD